MKDERRQINIALSDYISKLPVSISALINESTNEPEAHKNVDFDEKR